VEIEAMLHGKVIVVTGAASGIGRGIAAAAARHGARAVVIGDLTPEPKEGGDTTVELVQAAGAEGRFVTVDVTDEHELETLVAAAEEFGGVDCMVCNAGIAKPGDLATVSATDMDALIAVNLKGALATAQKAAAAMQGHGRGGSIVFISSMAGLKGTAINVGYGATKAGVNLLAAALADAHGPAAIRVNAICPGLIETTLAHSSSPEVAKRMASFVERMPLRRLGRPEEVGDVVAWLASDFSSFVTGVALPVDGGQTAVL
jgi:L-rhamnose 1-dehydrogenase